MLDFGAACGDNVDFFSGLNCQLEILDLYPQLVERPDRLSRTHEASAIQLLIAKILDQRPGNINEPKAFNLLLTWDLFDFLSAEQVRGLVAGMEPYVSVGSRLMAQVSYLDTVPSSPRRTRIQDRNTLLVDKTEGQRSSPRYTEPQLLKVMPGWEVEHCYLQRSGLREYLFQRR